MLTDEEKRYIQLQEQYRAEVKEALHESRGKSSALASFLNSNFGLWLLSAIFISGLGAAITWYKDYLERESSRADKVERLDIEIAYRISQQIELLAVEFELRDKGKSVEKPAPSSAVSMTKALTRSKGSPLISLYPEFSSMSVTALMAELRRHVQPSETSGIDDALLSLTNGTLTRDAEGKPKIVAGRLYGSVLKTRKQWTDAKFSYTDCNSEMPFC